MSPHADPTTALPHKRHRRHDPLSRMIAETLDHQLFQYALSQDSFSISEIRDQLLTLPELENVDASILRYRIRDRLNALEKQGLVDEVGITGKRPKLFKMRSEVAVGTSTDTAAEHSPDTPRNTTGTSGDTLLTHLEQERFRLQTTMQVAMGEAEHYKRLIARFPDEKAHISPFLETAIEQSSALQGQWEANLKLRRALSGASLDQDTHCHQETLP